MDDNDVFSYLHCAPSKFNQRSGRRISVSGLLSEWWHGSCLALINHSSDITKLQWAQRLFLGGDNIDGSETVMAWSVRVQVRRELTGGGHVPFMRYNLSGVWSAGSGDDHRGLSCTCTCFNVIKDAKVCDCVSIAWATMTHLILLCFGLLGKIFFLKN